MKKYALILLLFCLSLYSQESIKITGVSKFDYEGTPYTSTLYTLSGLDGVYKLYLLLTPDFKEWTTVFLLDLTWVGEININSWQKRNQWQLYDKTYKPVFWVIKIVKVADLDIEEVRPRK